MSPTPTSRDQTIDQDAPTISVRSLAIQSPGRGDVLKVRISAPLLGGNCPVILFSHGHGSSMDGYAPLVDYWSGHGFVVIQPTYLDARRLALADDDPRRPTIWRQRVADAKAVLDGLEELVMQVPGLAGRVDTDRIAAVGHSFGGQTTSLLLGARMVADGGNGEDMCDSRIEVGVLLASGGRGGADLSDFGRQYTPYLDMDFTDMTTPTLVVVGDADQSPLSNRGPDWFADPFEYAPGATALLTLRGGEHMLGGISGYAAAETTDEDPDRVALVQQATTAFLRSALSDDDPAWSDLRADLTTKTHAKGKIESK